MRGKMSETEKSFALKLYNDHGFSVEDLAVEFERSENFMRGVVGLEQVVEEKTKRTAFTTGYDQITCELDRGEIKFYLPKELTSEDAERVIEAIANHYNLVADTWEGNEEVIDLAVEEGYKPATFQDRIALMRQIIEEESIEDEMEVS